VFRKFFDSLKLELPRDKDPDELDRFRIPDNERHLARQTTFAPTYHRSRSVKEIQGRRAIMRPMEGRPDLHDYLWNRAGSGLPDSARWVIQGNASFAHPGTNVIFASAGGTHGFVVRVSRSNASKFPDLMPECDDGANEFVWLNSRLNQEEDRRLLAAGFEDASRVRHVT
jgi:hypothetical protein